MEKMTSSLASVLLVKLEVLFIFVVFTACMAEERALFLVMMEGDPVAFLGGSPSHKHNRLDPNR